MSADPNATISIKATVLPDPLPTLIFPHFTEVSDVSEFDAMFGVIAKDGFGNDLVDNVVYSVNGDLNKPGIYIVTYTVSDSNGNSVEASQVVLINDGSFIYGDGYIITGKSIEISTGTAKVISDSELVELTNISVYSIAENAYLNNPDIHVDRNNLVPISGNYQVIFSFNPSITLNVIVYDSDFIDLPNTGQQFGIGVIAMISLLGGILLVSRNKRKK